MRTAIKHFFLCTALFAIAASVTATEPDTLSRDLLRETMLTTELSATAATGDYAPLWLSANRYGLSSIRPYSGYLRARLERDILNDANRNWRIGYGLDLAVAAGHERVGIVQQAYIEGAWKKIRLTIGAKQQPMETQNPELSSGEMLLGINARPIPQVRLDFDWFAFPGTKGWWQWRLYGSYGWMTDGRWQESHASEGERYARNVKYHEKALYWQFGRKDIFPLTYEFGLRMATIFAGDCYNVRNVRVDNGASNNYHYHANLKAYWQALTAQGSDNTDGSNPNVAGNTLGSYIMQLRYHGSKWQARAYWERFFEDHSMLTVQYGIRDMLIGAEVTLPRNPFVTTAVFEFMTSTDQSGAVYHDETTNIPDKIAGLDNYYNHSIYAGWQHYGQPIGNPFITAPLYNEAIYADINRNVNGKSITSPTSLRFNNNRVKAWHIGLSGNPAPQWHWRAIASFTRNWGSYAYPFPSILRQQYYMAEATYHLRDKGTSISRVTTAPQHTSPSVLASGWHFSLALALDHGALIGNSFGAQLTVSKILSLKP